MSNRNSTLISNVRSGAAALLTGLLVLQTPPVWAAAPASKLEQRLAEAARSAESLDVIVWVRAEAGAERGFTPREIRDLHRPGLEALGTGIRELERDPAPDRARSDEEEKAALGREAVRLSDFERAELARLRGELDGRLDAMRRDVAAAVTRQPAGNRRAVARRIEQLGGRVRRELPLANALSATLPAGALDTLAGHPLVARVAEDRPTELELAVSMDSVRAPSFWNAAPTPITGGVFDAGIVDTGVQQNHPAFEGVRFYTNATAGSDGADSGHGTHVAGIIASGDATNTGGAFGLDAIIWSQQGSGSTIDESQSGTMSNMSWMAAEADQQPEVINHSLGYGTADVDDYNDNDSFYDALVEHFDLLVTKSAGNNGWSDSSPTLTHPATAYNLISVANMNDSGTADRADDVRSGTSSVGPTVDGRRKPDLTAPGTNILSTNNSWSGGASGDTDPNCGQTKSRRQGDDFSRCSGTSMAAPHVAAAVVLLADAGNLVPMAQKAVLINSADAWDSNGTSTTSDDGPVAGSLWDKSYGWGYLDLDGAFLRRHDYFLGSVLPRSSATHEDHRLYKGPMLAGDKVTLVWEKRAATFVEGDTASGRRRLSNLDLRLYRESNGSSVDSDLDVDDNVHQVAAAVDMDAIVKVVATDAAFDGASSEAFAVANEEGFRAITPPTFQHNYGAPAWVRSSQNFEVKAHAYNTGGAVAHGMTVMLGARSGITGTGTKMLASIPAGGGSVTTAGIGTATFMLATSGLAEGNYWLPITIQSQSYGETYLYQSSNGVLVKVDATAPQGVCGSALKSRSTIQVAFTASDAKSGVDRSMLYVKAPGTTTLTNSLRSATGTSGSMSYTPTVSGTYQFAVRSVDKAGNWEAIPTTRSECSVSY